MVNEHHYNGWLDFKNFCINFNQADDKEYWFRGQSDVNWEITPTYLRAGLQDLRETRDVLINPLTGKSMGNIGLPLYHEYLEKLMDGLQRFKESVLSHVENNKYEDYEGNDWWALGRHHGLHTPLIDWTLNPLIAYYFAILGFHGKQNFKNIDDFYIAGSCLGNNGNVVVWQMEIERELEKTGRFQYIADCKSDLNYRLKSQDGCFLLFLQPDDCFTLEEYLQRKGASEKLTKHVIKLDVNRASDDGHTTYSDIRKSIEELSRLGIRYSTLFPDLDGYAFEVNCILKGVLWE